MIRTSVLLFDKTLLYTVLSIAPQRGVVKATNVAAIAGASVVTFDTRKHSPVSL